MTPTAPRGIVRRVEFLGAELALGNLTLPLSDYATTGLRVVTVGPSGTGKTNAGLVLAEQLAMQGWLSVLLDPEGELADLYPGSEVKIDALDRTLREATPATILTVPVRDAEAFVPVARTLLEVADTHRRPMFLMIDEGQIFSTSSRKKDITGEAAALANDMVERGRKRSLDVFVTAHRFAGTLHRSVFANKNLSFIGRQEDPAAWSSLAPLFRGTGLSFVDLAALEPGEFFCFSRVGVQKVRMPMADALKASALPATTAQAALPRSFQQWDAAVRGITTDRLRALTPAVITLLGTVAGVSADQLAAGQRALVDELAAR